MLAKSWHVLPARRFPRGSLSREVRGMRPFRSGNLVGPESFLVLNAKILVVRCQPKATAGLIRISEKQYHASAGLARNCRLLLREPIRRLSLAAAIVHQKLA
jgi:hypothetical protein